MDIGWQIFWGVTLVVLCGGAWMLNLFALPGNWLAVGMVGLYVWLGPDQGRWAIGYVTAGCIFGLALLGEVLEFVAGALGATRAGASRRSTLYAVLGSVLGAIVGGIAGLPIPVIGSLLAALLFGAVGATAGAMYGEWSDGKSWQESWTVGHAAFWGRLFGTLGKFAAGAVMVVVITIAIFV